jgi:hypothetical protein
MTTRAETWLDLAAIGAMLVLTFALGYWVGAMGRCVP